MNQEISRSEYSQSEKLIQIGSYLREVRQEQGLSVEQIATKTMIQARLLRAIEAGNLEGLPEAIYVRGFIKRYAEFLGLNGNDVAKSFPLYPDTGDLDPTWQNSDVAQLRQTHLYLAYVALITVAVISLGAVLTKLSNRDVGPTPNLVEESSPPSLASSDEPVTADPESSDGVSESNPTSSVADPSEGAAVIENTPDTVSEALGDGDFESILQGPSLEEDLLATTLDPSLADKPVQVALELKDRSWLRVIVDGKQDFEGVLPEGTQRTWAAESSIVVRAGNAGGVLIAFNGSDTEPMGEPGAVSERQFSTEDVGTAQSAAR